MATPLKFVITGGAGCGKTSVITELKRRGHTTMPEAAITAIDALSRLIGIDEQRRWRNSHLDAFQALLLPMHRRLEAEATATAQGPVFLDRGVLDGLAYCEAAGVVPPPELSDLRMHSRPEYAAIFILAMPGRSQFEDRSHTGRADDFDGAVRIGGLLGGLYRGLGYTVHDIPYVPVAERAELVLDVVRRDFSS